MAVGNQNPSDVATDYASLRFVVQQLISQISTTALARVIDCTNDGGVVPVGTLTVQLLVNMLSGDDVAFQHSPIYKVPYARIQGGANAIIIDPEPGDIGVIGFCERDIGGVKVSRGISNPGSRRQYSKGDGVWLATVWAAQAPAQYFVFASDGVSLISPNRITLQAPTIRLMGELEQSNGDASFAQSVDVAADVIVQGEVTAGNIGLTTHKHPTAPAGPVSPPIP